VWTTVTGTGAPVRGTSPTFTTGIAVPNNSISDEELDEGGTFTWTGAHSFGGDVDMSASTPDAEGEIQWVDATDNLIAHDGSSNKVIASASTKNFQFTVADPENLAGDSCIVWSNETGKTITILGITASANVDDYIFTLFETTGTGAAAGGIVDVDSITTNGTVIFYDAETTAITHATIEDNNVVWFIPPATAADWVKVAVRYSIAN